MKNTLRLLGKAFLAGCLAFLAMTVFCLFYYNSPIHYPNDSGATDYKWYPKTFYSRWTEGISFGKTNNEGFLNSYDYEDGMKIDVLVMGSSHMEGFNVFQNESTASRLNALLQDKSVYNIGISGHNFLVCCDNFNAALEHYRPAEYIVIETRRLDFTAEELNSVLDGTLPETADNPGGILGFLSKNPFLRLIHFQFKSYMGQAAEGDEGAAANSQHQSAGDTREALDSVLSSLNKAASEYGTKIILLYHPSTQIDADGSLLLPDDEEYSAEFTELCEKNGITFLDMSERFKSEYETNHILPHGFVNSSVGSGHLNKYGHKMIADELYKIID